LPQLNTQLVRTCSYLRLNNTVTKPKSNSHKYRKVTGNNSNG
jgi:hypothetical protein